MYFDTQLGYESEIMDQWIEKEMHNVKGHALQKLSSIVAHFKLEISNVLAYGWFDSLPAAERLAEQMDLSKMDLLAIQEDLEGFKEEFLKDKDRNLND